MKKTDIDLKYLRTLSNKDLKKDSSAVAQYINSLYTSTSKMYLKQHRDWYINERFARGEHWVVFNKTTNKVVTLPLKQGEIRRTINKIRVQIRGIKNFIKRNQPRWEVHPNDDSDEAVEEARKKNKILQYIYRTRKIKQLLTDLIVSGTKFSIGILEGGVIEKDGQDYLDFWVDDAFEVLFDPSVKTVQDCRFIIVSGSKPTSYLEEKHGVKNLAISTKESSSDFKNNLIREKYNRDSSVGLRDLENTLIKTLWMKWVENGEVKVKFIIVTDSKTLKIEDTVYSKYPHFVYNPERDGSGIYSDPWIKDLISPNKSLDRTVSNIEGYIQRMLAGKWLIKQGVDVSTITDNGAEKIYYKGNVAPTQLNLAPLPSTPFIHAKNNEGWIEEMGGIGAASLGRVPTGIQSGKGVEALQAADAFTVAEPIENLEIMLAEVGEFILEIISKYQVNSKTIIEGGEKISFIGNVENPPKNVIVIKPSKVKVSIVPEIAYSEEAKKEILMRLAESKIIDEQTLFEYLNVSNIADIMDRVKKLKDENFKQEMVKQKESHRTSGEAPEDTADLANQENMAMIAGQEVPSTPQALWSPEHLELHKIFIQENQQDIDSNPNVKELFNNHINQEEQYNQ